MFVEEKENVLNKRMLVCRGGHIIHVQGRQRKLRKQPGVKEKSALKQALGDFIVDKEVVKIMILGRPSFTSCGIWAKLLFGAQFHHLKYGDDITSYMDRLR